MYSEQLTTHKTHSTLYVLQHERCKVNSLRLLKTITLIINVNIQLTLDNNFTYFPKYSSTPNTGFNDYYANGTMN